MSTAHQKHRSKADPHIAPDYSKLRACIATADELALLDASNVHDLVRRINRELNQNGRFPVTQSDFPTTRRKLLKLLERWKRLIHPTTPTN